jgi:membrane fusion protein (multidrug efflux system)
LSVFFPLLGTLVMLAACDSQDQGAAIEPPPVEVTAITVKAGDVPIVKEFVGKTASTKRVEIRSRVAGFLDERAYVEGDMVEEGQVLFQMDRKPFEATLQAAEAELGQQQARLENATANLARVEPLAQQNAVAQKELDDALAFYREAAAAVEAARANLTQAKLDLGYTTIRSPVTGQSSYSTQQEGAYIGTGADSLLTYVAQLSPMRVEFSVSENQLLRSRDLEKRGLLRPPPDAGYVVEIVLADGSVFPHTGHLTFADASLNEETGTFLIRAELDNPDLDLRPGMFVRIRLKGAERPNAILVPQTAVQQGAKGSFVWVVNAENKAEFRPVTVGPWHGEDWFVEEGLQDGEIVVVKGALKLRAGAPVTVKAPEDKPSGDGASKSPETAGTASASSSETDPKENSGSADAPDNAK